ncbi:MAG: hypothetical protein K2X87_20200 [Gemmataceae bacterium]|nr:hypothetical protein [Gemmataceae bacterium]
MSLRIQDLFRRVTRAPARRAAPPRVRARLSCTPLEDRTVPSAVVTVEAMKDPTEGGAAGTFRFTRSDTTGSLTVYFTAGGTASPGSDYTSIGNSVTFAAGSPTATKTVAAIDDAATDPNETVSVSVAYGPGYTAGSPNAATVIIADNEGVVLPTLYLDFTPYNNLPAHNLTVLWTVWDPAAQKDTTDSVVVPIPANADAQTVRDTVGTVLKNNGLSAEDKSNNRLVVQAGANLKLRQLRFSEANMPPPSTISGKIKLGNVLGDGVITPKRFVNGVEVPAP